MRPGHVAQRPDDPREAVPGECCRERSAAPRAAPGSGSSRQRGAVLSADDLRAQGVKLEVLSGTFNRDDPMGEAFFQMTGVFAQLERDLIRQRTNEGLEAARSRGRTGGRKAKLSDKQADEVRRLYAAREKTVAEIGELFGITRESVYRYVKAS
jgi:DNA invertase Pin-like site-specific DNA recombinase